MLIISHDVKARAMIPFLKCFKANWATEAYLRRSWRNRKGHLKGKETKQKAAGTDTSITLDDTEDDKRGSANKMDDE
jgi:hypothetical protein